MITRAIRNNNPCNIRQGDPWRGMMIRAMMSPDQLAEHAFCVFAEAKWGFRAAAIIVSNDLKRGIDTCTKLIERWAPPNENNTTAYIGAVAKEVGVDPNFMLHNDRPTISKLLKAMATHEAGSWPAEWDAELSSGLDLAKF